MLYLLLLLVILQLLEQLCALERVRDELWWIALVEAWVRCDDHVLQHHDLLLQLVVAMLAIVVKHLIEQLLHLFPVRAFDELAVDQWVFLLLFCQFLGFLIDFNFLGEYAVQLVLDLGHFLKFRQVCANLPLEAEMVEEELLLGQRIEAGRKADGPLIAADHEEQENDSESHADLHAGDDYHLRALLLMQLRKI